MGVRAWPVAVDLGDGLVLRAPDPVDAEGMADAINSSLDHLRPWMPFAAEPAAVDQQAVRLAIAGEAFAAGADATYSILDGDEVVGSLGIHGRAGPRAYEIGYWLRADREGRGIATRAARAAVRMAIDAGRAERLVIRCDAANTPSAAVAGRLGFSHVDTVEEADPVDAGRTRRMMIWELRRSTEGEPRSAGSPALR
jgi:RimJ/RimL family protein N-acetyltransferase